MHELMTVVATAMAAMTDAQARISCARLEVALDCCVDVMLLDRGQYTGPPAFIQGRPDCVV
jgi:hypothetical protein